MVCVLPPIVSWLCGPAFRAGFGRVSDRVPAAWRVRGEAGSAAWTALAGVVGTPYIKLILFELLFDWRLLLLILFVFDYVQILKVVLIVLLLELNIVLEILNVLVLVRPWRTAEFSTVQRLLLCLLHRPLAY